MYTVEEARALILGEAAPLPVERVHILEALGRVVAEDIVTDIDIAPFDNSAMDGFAVVSADTAASRPSIPVVLDVIGEIAAGAVPPCIVGPGTAVRIMTGAPLPQGADAVVMMEHTTPIAGDGHAGGSIAVNRPVRPGENVRRRGETAHAGEPVMKAGEPVTTAAAGIFAASGHLEVPVFRRPTVAILSTGSELVDAHEVPGRGKIRNSNAYALAAQVKSAGGIPILSGIVHDDEAATRAAFAKAAEMADVVVSSGGVCLGDFDYVNRALGEIAEIKYSRIRMKPASAQVHALIGGTVPFFGLPGNPSATFVAFEVLVRPLLRQLQGFTAVERPTVRAMLTQSLTKKPGHVHFLRGKMTSAADEDGWIGYRVGLAGGQSASLLKTMHLANCLIVLPENQAAFPANTLVDCTRLDVEEGTA